MHHGETRRQLVLEISLRWGGPWHYCAEKRDQTDNFSQCCPTVRCPQPPRRAPATNVQILLSSAAITHQAATAIFPCLNCPPAVPFRQDTTETRNSTKNPGYLTQNIPFTQFLEKASTSRWNLICFQKFGKLEYIAPLPKRFSRIVPIQPSLICADVCHWCVGYRLVRIWDGSDGPTDELRALWDWWGGWVSICKLQDCNRYCRSWLGWHKCEKCKIMFRKEFVVKKFWFCRREVCWTIYNHRQSMSDCRLR